MENLGRKMDIMETDGGMEAPNPRDDVRNLLSLARHLVSQGKPSAALQAVMMAMRSNGGEAAVFETLDRTRQLYRNRLQSNAAADELASLFAECAIAEAQPVQSDLSPFDTGGGGPVTHDVCETSILAESGRNQIVLDAFSDGSSFICLRCGGLVSNVRKDEHIAFWCSQI